MQFTHVVWHDSKNTYIIRPSKDTVLIGPMEFHSYRMNGNTDVYPIIKIVASVVYVGPYMRTDYVS